MDTSYHNSPLQQDITTLNAHVNFALGTHRSNNFNYTECMTICKMDCVYSHVWVQKIRNDKNGHVTNC